MKPKGYLVFTTHDGDEIDATFVPENEKKIISRLMAISTDREMETAVVHFNEWSEKHAPAKWFTQTRYVKKWPFNDHHILGTFYLLVY